MLETSFIAFRLQPFHQNFSKRIVSTPKIYFYDLGLATHLLGITSVQELNVHFAKGALFENLVINEIQKNILNTGRQPWLYFWRDYSQHEVDLIIQEGVKIKAVEIKSGKTIQNDFFNGLIYFEKMAKDVSLHLVYGGTENQTRSNAKVYSIGDLYKI